MKLPQLFGAISFCAFDSFPELRYKEYGTSIGFNVFLFWERRQKMIWHGWPDWTQADVIVLLVIMLLAAAMVLAAAYVPWDE